METDLASAIGASSVSFLGSGSFGDTWCASGLDGNSNLRAVKVLRPEFFNARLLAREVEGLSEFNHPGILRFHDVRAIILQGVEQHILVCEYIGGGSVGQALKLGGLPNHTDVRKFARGLFEAVAVLHLKDKIHRDIKPDNVMLRDGEWGAPVLIDFGLVRSLTGDTITRYPAMVGSIPWMAPEQLQGERARKAGDNWACGVILYQLLTGQHPFFHGINVHDLEPEELVDLVSVPPPDLPSEVPGDLASVVTRLLTSEPANQRGSAMRALKNLQGSKSK